MIHGALGGDRDVVDQLKLGELEFYVVGVHGLNGIAPNFQLFDQLKLGELEFYVSVSTGCTVCLQGASRVLPSDGGRGTCRVCQ